MIRVCLTGAESTGKTTLAPRLAAAFGGVVVAEFGRTWAETHGTAFAAADLRAIAAGHVAARVAAEARRPALIVEDTDIVTTAAWAEMLFGAPDPALEAIPATADLYLMFGPDVPWIDDGTRLFGSDDRRARFDALLRAAFARRGIVPVIVAGDWAERQAAAEDAITRAFGLHPTEPAR